MSKFEENLGREGFTSKEAETAGPAEGSKEEPARFAADSPFPAFRMIPAGSRPIEPELSKPTLMMKLMPIAVIIAAATIVAVALMR